ncbi:MAG: myxococcus cysteine-rich repeat containing protein, partial [Planctomycetota bacterium]
FDFRFAVTGGELASFYAGRHVVVTLTSENSNFDGDFTRDFDGDAKGNIVGVGPFCGDGILDPGEECDDGNLEPGDGCSPTCDTEEFGGQGCTPGFWKQRHHLDAWMVYHPDDLFDDVFGVDATGDLTLLETLKRGGGGENAFGRHAVAALLNAASTDVDYFYAIAGVIAMVQDAYATGDFEPTKNLFEGENESGCPVSTNSKDDQKRGRSR